MDVVSKLSPRATYSCIQCGSKTMWHKAKETLQSFVRKNPSTTEEMCDTPIRQNIVTRTVVELREPLLESDPE